MREPRESLIRGGRVLLGVLKRVVAYRDMETEIDDTPSKDPYRELERLSTRLDSTRGAFEVYKITERMDRISRQL